MSNLEPTVSAYRHIERAQLEAVLHSDLPEASTIVDAANQAMHEHEGYVDRLSRAAANGSNSDFLEEKVNMETFARYVAWRALVISQERGDNDD